MTFNLTVNPRLEWIAALEGLRGVAVIAVMLFHFRTSQWFPGGLLGVDIFFVLSGFLITTLLLQEHVANGTISLRRFYARRARRLLPALFVFLAVYSGIVIIFASNEFTGAPTPRLVLQSCVATVLYVFNLLKMADVRVAPGLSHLWSLSVEEQFYFLWPLVLATGLKLRIAPGLLAASTATLVALCGAMVIFVDGSHSRFYFGTDFRAQELLAGAFLAQLYVGGVVHRGLTANRLFLAAVTLSAVLIAFWLVALPNRFDFLFKGSYALVALSAGLLVCYAALANPPILNSRVLCYVGRRSYALYLWHLPIGFWLRDWHLAPHVIGAFVLSFVAAELSYRLVERPFLAGRRAKADAASTDAPPSQPPGEERLAA